MQEAQAFWDKILTYVITNGMGFLYAILILIIGKWVAKFLASIAEKTMRKSKVNETLVLFTKNILYFMLLLFVIIAALSRVGVKTDPLVALFGGAALAVGLALQGTLSNFAAGVMLILFQPFKVGDSVEAGGAAGKVKEIQIFSTIIMTADNKKVIVPNSKITADKITISL